MKYIYCLRIKFDGNSSKITKVLNFNPSKTDDLIWEYEVIKREEDDCFDFINNFLDILDGKYSDLSNVGVNTEDITIWMYYEYNQQCNMEFSPKQMKRIGQAGIALCISCWEEFEGNL